MVVRAGGTDRVCGDTGARGTQDKAPGARPPTAGRNEVGGHRTAGEGVSRPAGRVNTLNLTGSYLIPASSQAFLNCLVQMSLAL